MDRVVLCQVVLPCLRVVLFPGGALLEPGGGVFMLFPRLDDMAISRSGS